MEISVDNMINQKKFRMQQEKQNERNKKLLENRKFKIKRTMPLNKKPTHFPENIQEHFKKQEINQLETEGEIIEIKEKLKDGLKNIMAIPAKEKSITLKEKIDNSKFMNEYINKNTNLSMLDWMNEHLVFAGLYFNYYNDTMTGK